MEAEITLLYWLVTHQTTHGSYGCRDMCSRLRLGERRLDWEMSMLWTELGDGNGFPFKGAWLWYGGALAARHFREHRLWFYACVRKQVILGIYSFHPASCRKCYHTHQLKARARHARVEALCLAPHMALTLSVTKNS